MSQPKRQPDEVSFEDAMQRLDEIVQDMETDRMPLEEMIHSYEEGISLLKQCRARLENARRRVELISADLDSGKATTVPFDESSGEAGDETADPTRVRQSPPKRRKAAESDDIRLF
ncbi:MAG: exodeoxyribonuclease VII small subunit [Verrucomicrobiaceae bacterium]|jgi:exodeoxyribonuclease VII small subunit|nr:exodeoxyribonuclease VII small subunit [Verrucomicrobiaceae bacterium]